MSATDPEPAAPDPDNEEMAEAILEHAKDQRQAEQEKQTQAAKDKQQILNAVQSETVDIRLYGTRVECRVMTGEQEDWLDDISAQFMDVDDEDELSKEEFEDYKDAREDMIDILADLAVAGEYDREFWKQLPSAKRQQALADIREGGLNADRAGN